MKIAVFNHPFSDFYTSPSRLSPSVPDHLANILAAYGDHDFFCVDVLSKRPREEPLPNALRHLRPYLIGDESRYAFFSGCYSFGRVDNFNHKQFRRFSPDCIFVTSFAFCYFDGFQKQVRYLKQLVPHIPIIAGGAGPSSFPRYYMQNSPVNAVVKGPLEGALPKLLSHLKSIKNSEETPSLSEGRTKQKPLLFAAEDKTASIAPYVYYNRRRNTVQLQVTRGCPRRCAYCSIHSNSAGVWQKVPVESVLASLSTLPLAEDTHFDFEDDNITFDRDYCIALFKEIRRKVPRAAFSAQNGIDFTTLDDDLIQTLANLGLTQLHLSITSTNSKTLKAHGRQNYVDHFLRVMEAVKRHRIFTTVYYICGLPDDPVENVLDTLEFLMSRPVLIGISPFYAVPGTKLVKDPKDLSPLLCKGSSFHPMGELTSAQMIAFFMFTRVINFLKSTHNADWQTLGEINSPSVKQRDRVRKEYTKRAWIHSIRRRQLHGYRTRDADTSPLKFVPYPLDESLSKTLFQMILGASCIVGTDGQQLDKALWMKQ